MTRARKARIPVNAEKRIIFSEAQWKRIEQAYGHSLPQPIRAGILLATEALRLVGSAERNAPSQKKMIEKTKKLRDAAQSLLQEVHCPVRKDSACTSFEDLTEGLAMAVKEFPNDHLQFLMVVDSVLTGCNLMLRWESDDGLREGSSWDAWVQLIDEVMQHHGLPGAARKDSDKRYPDRPSSQFVLLIDKLQEYIPQELQRHTQSTDALAGAIHRARKSNWWPDLLPPNLTEEDRLFLEPSDEQLKKHNEALQKLAMDPNWVQIRPGSFKRVETIALEDEIEKSMKEQKGTAQSQ